MKLNYIPIFITLMFFFPCTTAIKIGEEKLVETSGKKPDWVKSDKDFFIKKGIMYFRSIITNRDDLAFAKREAKGECVKNITEKINIRVRTEFKQATEGNNISPKSLSYFTSDAIASSAYAYPFCKYEETKDEYENLFFKVQNSTSESSSEELSFFEQKKERELERFKNLRDKFSYISAGIYLVNLLDAFIFGTILEDIFTREDLGKIQIVRTFAPGKAGIAVRFNF